MQWSRPLPSALGVGGTTVLVLAVDRAAPSTAVEAGMGLVAFLLLLALTRRVPTADRRQVWTCVAIATVVEIFGSVVWGVYRYRLGGVPLYVPPGHGLVYLTALRLSRLPEVISHSQRTVHLARTAAGIWALAGLAVPVAVGRPPDVFGALWFVYFATFLRRRSRAPFFAVVFLLTSLLEIAGTAFGDWTWRSVAPGLGIGVGNPPSVIAGAYCVLDSLVLLSLAGCARLVRAKPLIWAKCTVSDDSGVIMRNDITT